MNYSSETDDPNVREGITREDGQWVEHDLIWHNGAWLPEDADHGITSNTPSRWSQLSRLDQALRFTGVLAIGALVCAGLLAITGTYWSEGNDHAPSASGSNAAVTIVIYIALALLLAVGALAITKLSRWLWKRGEHSSGQESTRSRNPTG